MGAVLLANIFCQFVAGCVLVIEYFDCAFFMPCFV